MVRCLWAFCETAVIPDDFGQAESDGTIKGWLSFELGWLKSTSNHESANQCFLASSVFLPTDGSTPLTRTCIKHCTQVDLHSSKPLNRVSIHANLFQFRSNWIANRFIMHAHVQTGVLLRLRFEFRISIHSSAGTGWMAVRQYADKKKRAKKKIVGPGPENSHTKT